MKSKYGLPLSFLSLLFLIAILATGTVAQVKQDELPSGKDILKRHVEATGGKEAYDKIKNRHFTAELEIVNAGIVLDVETYAAKPNKMLAILKAEAIGTVRKGCDGKIVWSLSDMQGPIVEKGASLENQIRDSQFDRLAYWEDAYESVECEAIEKVGDSDCYQVVLKPKKNKNMELKDESALTIYFDVNSFLAKKIESKVVSDAGAIDITAFPSDYKEIDGIKIPYQTKLEMVGQARVLKMKSIKHNVKMDKDLFEPPQEIKELIKKR